MDEQAGDGANNCKRYDAVSRRYLVPLTEDGENRECHATQYVNRPTERAGPAPFDESLQIVVMRMEPNTGNLLAQFLGVIRERGLEGGWAKSQKTGVRNHAHA